MSRLANTDVEQRAEAVLKRCGIRAAPVPVDRIAKALGAVLRYSPLDEELSGMIYIKDDVPIIGVNALHHPNRQRFTIAHEIGHLELHRNLITTAVHVDKEFLMRSQKSALGTDRTEVEANKFASQLLIPQFLLDDLIADLKFDIDDDAPLEKLAKMFRVSRKVVEYRIGNYL